MKSTDLGKSIEALFKLIEKRKKEKPKGSYTVSLLENGLDKVCKKVGEEASEVIIGAKNGNKDEVIYETVDLIYHLLVLMSILDIKPEDINKELISRYEKKK